MDALAPTAGVAHFFCTLAELGATVGLCFGVLFMPIVIAHDFYVSKGLWALPRELATGSIDAWIVAFQIAFGCYVVCSIMAEFYRRLIKKEE